MTESTYRFEHVSDAELLTSTRHLVGRSNQLLGELLAHLAEVEARGIHRLRACSSLYAYCVYELRFSEDAAFRRARAARVARQFPVILQSVADGELHLTALVMLAPHLTEENHCELLALAKHRTKREVLRIVRALAPEPTVPDRVEPRGPELIGITMPRAPSWRSFVESLGSAVRELPAGDRPKDWADRASAARELGCDARVAATERVEDTPALPRVERYKVQFTASQEYVDLLERAQDLLSHAVPNRSLEEVHLRALRLLVERLEKRKYGAPRSKPAVENAQTQRRVQQSKNHTHATRRRVGSAAVRREVRDRDGARCTFVDDSGQRCRETRFLESHHRFAHARGGPPSTDNLTLRCQAHNTLAAEHDFGREFIQERVANSAVERRIAARPPP